MIKKKVNRIVSEILIGSAGLAVSSWLTISGVAPAGITCAGSISFLSKNSTLIANEYFSKLKIKYTKLGDWNNKVILLYEKTLKEAMVDKKNRSKRSRETETDL